MNGANKKKRYNLILFKSFSVFFIIATTIVFVPLTYASLLIAGEKNQQDSVTIRNDEYRFEVSIPQNWSFRKIVQQDPYEEMKSGLYSSSISTDEKEPENWNGFKLT